MPKFVKAWMQIDCKLNNKTISIDMDAKVPELLPSKCHSPLPRKATLRVTPTWMWLPHECDPLICIIFGSQTNFIGTLIHI